MIQSEWGPSETFGEHWFDDSNSSPENSPSDCIIPMESVDDRRKHRRRRNRQSKLDELQEDRGSNFEDVLDFI